MFPSFNLQNVSAYMWNTLGNVLVVNWIILFQQTLTVPPSHPWTPSQDKYTDRHSVAAVSLLGHGDVAVDVDGSSPGQSLRTQLYTVRVQHHVVVEHAEVDLVPVLVKHLERNRQQWKTKRNLCCDRLLVKTGDRFVDHLIIEWKIEPKIDPFLHLTFYLQTIYIAYYL